MNDIQIIIYLIVGIAGLFLGAESLIRGASSVAIKLGISPLVVGLTVVAFATSSPELVVSIRAAIEGSGGIVVGNVVGSNICNIGLILGLTALIFPVSVKMQLIRREIPIMFFTSLLFVLFLLNNSVERLEGLILFAGIIIYMIYSYFAAKKDKDEKFEFDEVVPQPIKRISVSIILIIAGLVLLPLGADFFVTGAIDAATKLGFSEAVIGITIVAFGTSLPELATSIIAALKKENDIAIGNVVGSNIFNVLSIIGISSLIKPYKAEGITSVDLIVMLLFMALLLPLSRSGFKLKRWEGGLLLLGYVVYMIYLVR